MDQGKLTYEEKREAKKREHLSNEKGLKQRKMLQVLVSSIVAVVIIAMLGFWAASQGPKGPDYSKAFPIQGREHIPVGSVRPVYNSNPPSSGSHYADPAREGFYETPLADQQLVHNLEHGDIWIAYHPRVSAEVKTYLRSLAGGKTIVTARQTNEFDISLVAWGRVDGFNLQNGVKEEERISDFIKRYMDRGPEKIPSQAM